MKAPTVTRPALAGSREYFDRWTFKQISTLVTTQAATGWAGYRWLPKATRQTSASGRRSHPEAPGSQPLSALAIRTDAWSSRNKTRALPILGLEPNTRTDGRVRRGCSGGRTSGHGGAIMAGLTFSTGDATAPPGSDVPSAKELFAMGVLGLDLRRDGRVVLMNQIADVLQIPSGGWRHGQSKLFEGPDVRLVALLQTLAKESKARVIGGNLERAAKFTHVNIMLALVSAAREHHSALTATGGGLINSFEEGGLDFLWDEKEKLGLPHSVTKTWKRVEPFRNDETNNFVHPA